MVLVDQAELQVLVVHPEQAVVQAQAAPLVLQEQVVHLVQVAQAVPQAHQVLQELVEVQAQAVLQVHQDHQVQVVLQEHLDHPDLQELAVVQDLQAQVARVALLALQEQVA